MITQRIDVPAVSVLRCLSLFPEGGMGQTRAWMLAFTHFPGDGGMILTGENRRTPRKTCPSATLSTTNLTWIDLGANPCLRGEMPATNDLSHGTVTLRQLRTRNCSLGLKLDPPPTPVQQFAPLSFIVLMMEAVGTSQTSVYFCESAQRYIPEGCHLLELRDHKKGTFCKK
jgi:hypothetical protein